jgi:hypothetical protein
VIAEAAGTAILAETRIAESGRDVCARQ